MPETLNEGLSLRQYTSPIQALSMKSFQETPNGDLQPKKLLRPLDWLGFSDYS